LTIFNYYGIPLKEWRKLKKERKRAIEIILAPLIISILATSVTVQQTRANLPILLFIVPLAGMAATAVAILSDVPPLAQVSAAAFGIILGVIGVVGTTGVMVMTLSVMAMLSAGLLLVGGLLLSSVVAIRILEVSLREEENLFDSGL